MTERPAAATASREIPAHGASPRASAASLDEFDLRPDPADPSLTERVSGLDQEGRRTETSVVVERPLTLFLNRQEIVTMMTIGDYPDLLALGYLLNQNMLSADDVIEAVDYDAELETVVVRTARETDYEEKLKKKVRTSGCAQGTVFGDLMDEIENVTCRPGRCSRPPGFMPSAARSTRRPACTWRPGRFTAAFSARPGGRWSTWKTWAGTTPSIR